MICGGNYAFGDNSQLLLAYKTQHEHCNVPRSDKVLGLIVKNWRATRLSDDKVKRLDDLGFTWNKCEQDWEDNFQLLLAYKEKHGHCNLPVSYESLGNWLCKQRQRKSNLSANQVDRLEELGFKWNLKFGSKDDKGLGSCRNSWIRLDPIQI